MRTLARWCIERSARLQRVIDAWHVLCGHTGGDVTINIYVPDAYVPDMTMDVLNASVYPVYVIVNLVPASIRRARS